MKIAVITDDGKTVSHHFGRAAYYFVAHIENGQITNTELREKLGHTHFASEPDVVEHGQHGFGPQAQSRHAQMVTAINDCHVLLCGGMGAGAYQGMLTSGIKPLVTDISTIDEAIQAYLQGRLEDRTDLLH